MIIILFIKRLCIHLSKCILYINTNYFSKHLIYPLVICFFGCTSSSLPMCMDVKKIRIRDYPWIKFATGRK